MLFTRGKLRCRLIVRPRRHADVALNIIVQFSLPTMALRAVVLEFHELLLRALASRTVIFN